MQLFRALQDDKEELTDRLAQINVEFDLLRFEAIPDRMDEQGITNVKLEGLGKVSLEGELFVEIAAANKPAFYLWLDEHGFGDLVQSTISGQTLKAFVKGQMKKGNELPFYVKARPASKAKLTRG